MTSITTNEDRGFSILALSKKKFFALKLEPLDQIRRNFQFSKHKEFLKSGGIADSMQHPFR